MRVIRPSDPDFVYNENFPGNLQPRPISAKSVDAEAVRTTLNNYHDNFRRQKRFDREMGDALVATNKRINRCLDWLVVIGIFTLIALGIALR